jgi:hypothetical protein
MHFCLMYTVQKLRREFLKHPVHYVHRASCVILHGDKQDSICSSVAVDDSVM